MGDRARKDSRRAGGCTRVATVAIGLGLVLVLVACKASGDDGSSEPKKLLSADTAQRLEQLFEPMQTSGSVACNHLEVKTHRALWDRFTYPTRTRVCEIVFKTGTDGGASRYEFRNIGGVDYPMKFVIGKRNFLVLGTASLEVFGGEPRFEIAANGNVLAQEAGASVEEGETVRVENGSWSVR